MKKQSQFHREGFILSFHRNDIVHHTANLNGFSLVEVAMSLAIFGLAIIPVIGLMVTGLNISRNAVDTQVIERITQQVIPFAKDTDNGHQNFTEQGFLAQTSQRQVFRAEWRNVTNIRNSNNNNAAGMLRKSNYREITIVHVPSNRVQKMTNIVFYE